MVLDFSRAPAWQGVAESARSRRPVNPRPAPSSRKRDSRVGGVTARLTGFVPDFLRPRRGGHSQKDQTMNHITSGHVRAFQAVRSPLYDNITLASCLINGEPAVAIVMVDDAGKNTFAVMPLFVSITAGMKLVFPGENRATDGGGGGPTNPREAFVVNKTMTQPRPA
jgi:hypothetical protein